jgi:hypothetical protein
LAVGILYLLAFINKAMYTEQDVEVCLKLPVLTMVPSFDAMRDGKGIKRKKSENYEAAVALKV